MRRVLINRTENALLDEHSKNIDFAGQVATLRNVKKSIFLRIDLPKRVYQLENPT